MADIRLIPNDPLLAQGCQQLAERLREQGHNVEIDALREERAAGGVGEQILIGIISSAAWELLKPVIVPLITEWFTEQPRRPRRPLRMPIYEEGDQADELLFGDD